MADLADVRRMEAVGFRSFPSTTTHYDGTWAIRLTAGHPAKRLNSVTPLDPSDTSDLERRVELARRRFGGFGRPLIFRNSPLAPAELDRLLDDMGWETFDDSLVMAAGLDASDFSETVDQVPLQDVGRWVDAWLALAGEGCERKPGMVEVISAIKPETGLFLVEDGMGSPVSAVRCVRDNDLAGIFEMETEAARRRRGHAASVLASALKWALSRGARTAWLQVNADNMAARQLYERFGFGEVYRYAYRRAP
jgi:GNAT superfamily N-acetyltransferase